MPYRTPYNRRRLNLNTVAFQPTVFNPIEFRPVEQDYSILERAMAKQEARQKEAVAQQTAVDVALSEIEKQLYNTPEMNEWFSGVKQSIKNNIETASAVGDYASAINIAKQQVGRLSESDVTGRLEASKNYNAWLDDLQKKSDAGFITPDTKKYFEKTHPFVYNDAYDANGNIIKGDTYQNMETPVKDINIDEFSEKAFRYATPKKPGSGNYHVTNANGVSNAHTLEYVDEKTIIENLNEIFSLQDGARAALEQRYIVQKDKYKELEQKLLDNPDDPDIKQAFEMQKAVMSKGQGIIDFEHFVARTIGQNLITKNRAYRYETSSRIEKQKEANPTQTTTDNTQGDGAGTPGGATGSDGADNTPKPKTKGVR